MLPAGWGVSATKNRGEQGSFWVWRAVGKIFEIRKIFVRFLKMERKPWWLESMENDMKKNGRGRQAVVKCQNTI